MKMPIPERPFYELTIEGGKLTEIRLISGHEEAETKLASDGLTVWVGPWTARVITDDNKINRIVVQHQGQRAHHRPLADGVLLLAYRQQNGRAYSQLTRRENLPENKPRSLPFKFTKFHVSQCYQVSKTDGVFAMDWVSDGDTARELNWVFSDGEVKYRFADTDQEIVSLAAPELYDACDTLEATVSHSSWTVHVHLEQRESKFRRTVTLYCSEEWVDPTLIALKECLSDYLKYNHAGVRSFVQPLRRFLL